MKENKKYICRIESLGDLLDAAVLLEETEEDRFIASYRGVKCVAVYDGMTGRHKVYDVTGIIPDGSHET